MKYFQCQSRTVINCKTAKTVKKAGGPNALNSSHVYFAGFSTHNCYKKGGTGRQVWENKRLCKEMLKRKLQIIQKLIFTDISGYIKI